MKPTLHRPSVGEAFQRKFDGFRGYGLRTELLEIAMIPELGAAVTSIRSIRTGREWLWRRPGGLRLFRNTIGDPFECSPLCGAVECVPTLSPNHVLPDHGEAWSSAWEFDEVAWQQGVIRTSLRLSLLPLELERWIDITGNAATFTYSIRNLSSEPVAFLWAFHPLFEWLAGDRLHLPESVREVRVTASKGIPELDGRDCCRWPEPRPGLRLDRMGFGAARRCYVKLFADFSCNGEGWAALSRDDGQIEFRFEPRQISHLGLWLTEAGWHGYTHAAIEPTNTMADAITGAPSEWIGPFAERRWSFQIRVQ